MRDHRTGRTASVIVLMVLALPLAALAESPAAREPYSEQRLRHSEIRSRAEELSRDPRLSRFDVKAAEARLDDDREMTKFDHQASTPGGSAAATPKLKSYNDSLEETIRKMLDYVRR